ncbi:hypothetical protein HAX54_014828, partial [Datura stramonium]|nr:hypothetical protein [Datura stramonium]
WQEQSVTMSSFRRKKIRARNRESMVEKGGREEKIALEAHCRRSGVARQVVVVKDRGDGRRI